MRRSKFIVALVFLLMLTGCDDLNSDLSSSNNDSSLNSNYDSSSSSQGGKPNSRPDSGDSSESSSNESSVPSSEGSSENSQGSSSSGSSSNSNTNTSDSTSYPQSNSSTIVTQKASEEYINAYYSSISVSLTGSSLASALESRLKAERKSSFSYKSLQNTAFIYTDVDPMRPNDGYIVSFYSGKAVKGYSGMNKEHTWPNSHGGGKIENDPHMVRPTLTSENSSRGNEYFAGPGAAGWDPASLGDYSARGMSARIVLYGALIGKSSGLELEDVGRGQGSGTGNKMGKLGDLLKWNLEYPVNQKEIIRNETLDGPLNYNRNPFIDRPEYACQIWGNTNDNTRNICASY